MSAGAAPSAPAGSPGRGGPGAARRRRALALASVILANGMAVIDYNIVSVAIPRLLRAFPGSTLAGLSWTITGYTVVFAAVLLPAGGLADRLGARRIFLGGLAVFTAGSLACALAPGPLGLVLARMLQAVGGGAVVAQAISVGLSEFPGRPSHVFGLLGAVGGVAGASGPALGSALLALGGWRWIFLINLPLGALALACGALGIRSGAPARGGAGGAGPGAGTGTGGRGLPDLIGIVLLAGGIAALVLGLVEGPGRGWTDGGVLGPLGAGLALTAWGVRRSLRHPRPAADFTLLRAGPTAAGNAAMALLSVTQFAVVLCVALFLTERWGYSALAAGAALTPGPLTSAVVSWGSGPLVRRVGSRRIIVAGGLVGAAGWCWPLLAGPLTGADGYAVVLLPALVVGTAGMAAASVAIGPLAMAEVPPDRFGSGSALVMLSRSAGAAVGIGALAAVLHDPAEGAFRVAWAGLAAFLVATALAGAASPIPSAPGGRAAGEPGHDAGRDAAERAGEAVDED
ncbi:MFS transporter [Actinomadura xylanilytica]|uniref:MFS transporter n=1 Tax=Actinomadura xylanilytica TaxID=887459 RepID=UPI00255AC25A|nr:MFS transporter [Actinomadura xylanilytica]MDL4771041.1 MFS transporter [Actinomadura xylanilytica]